MTLRNDILWDWIFVWVEWPLFMSCVTSHSWSLCTKLREPVRMNTTWSCWGKKPAVTFQYVWMIGHFHRLYFRLRGTFRVCFVMLLVINGCVTRMSSKLVVIFSRSMIFSATSTFFRIQCAFHTFAKAPCRNEWILIPLKNDREQYAYLSDLFDKTIV